MIDNRERELSLMDENASKQNDRLTELKTELKRSNEEGESMREVIDEMRTKMSEAMKEVERLMVNNEKPSERYIRPLSNTIIIILELIWNVV